MSFTFILPIIHPDADTVHDYGQVEAAFRQTLDSLQQQLCSNVHIIVVCCRVPAWSSDTGRNVHYLNVGESTVFAANRNHYRIDKGLKYTLGILYAFQHLKTRLFMLADADDYVDTRVADYALNALDTELADVDVDGFVINRGLQVEVGAQREQDFSYENAFLVRQFDTTCGTCRILKQQSVQRMLLQIDAGILDRASRWFSARKDNAVSVSLEACDWLDVTTRDTYEEAWHPVNILGRHIDQKAYFQLLNFPLVGAAKACGHGNHVGPRQGGLHDEKIVGRVPVALFRTRFGLDRGRLFRSDLVTRLTLSLSAYLGRLNARLRNTAS